MIKISSSTLKQNLREVMCTIEKNPSTPVIVSTYKEPKVVIMSYELWEKQNSKKKPSLKELKKFMFKTKEKTDYAKTIRKMRDE
jgi:prevent-host-death family protein